MDEKTADLRDLFVDATGSESVTERQDADRGTLVDRDDEAVDDAVRDLVAAMRDRYGFSTPLDDAAYALVARGRFDGADDAAVATAIRDALAEREEGDDEISIVECAEKLDAAPDTVARYAAVARTDIASTRANDRFRDAFRDLLTDADIEGSLASDAREDGLREATEDIETDVSL